MTDFIYAPLLGQSNAQNMHDFVGDDHAGFTRFEETLTQLTGTTTISAFYDETGDPITAAIGGSAVDGDVTSLPDHKTWWYPDSNQPGGALLNAVSLLQSQYQTLAAQGDVSMIILWSQGEQTAEAYAAAAPADKADIIQRYSDATRAIFDYLESELGFDMDFYLIQTGHLQKEGALNEGMTEAEIMAVNDGVDQVRLAQEALAATHTDTHLALNQDDLAMAFETGLPNKATDKWHFSPDSYEITGYRLAHIVADEMKLAQPPATPLIEFFETSNQIEPATSPLAEFFEGSNQADTLWGGALDDSIFGKTGDDSLRGLEGNDYILGAEGNDFIRGDGGNDSLLGGDDDDRLYGGGDDDALLGEAGDDFLNGENGHDFLMGGAGADFLRGGDDADTLIGGAGRDRLTGDEGEDIFRFFETTESVRQASQQDVIMDFQQGTDLIDLTGLGFSMVMSGQTEAGQLRIIYHSTLDRTYIRDDHGSDFEFFLEGDFSQTLTSDDFILDSPLIATPATSGDDNLNGNNNNNRLVGLGGDDEISGNIGNDTINGGAGQDTLAGGAGADIFQFTSLYDSTNGEGATARKYDAITDFEVGVDKIQLTGLGFTGLDSDGGRTETGEIRLAYSATTDRTYVRSDNVDFEFYLDGDYRLTLTEADFYFGEQTQQLLGSDNKDSLIGSSANEFMDGGAERDSLQGGAGNDLLDGGLGRDGLSGGEGADIFRFSHLEDSQRGPEGARTYDKITDFEVGIDQIDLSALTFFTVNTSGKQQGELRMKYSINSDRTYITDQNGSGFEFYLEGDYTALLTPADFIFS